MNKMCHIELTPIAHTLADQLVITISTPCYANDVSPKLVGVAALDLTLSDLLAGVEYFREGELSYAFLIDSEGGYHC